ncbi:ATP-binding protein [Natranaerobius thermophilus]|uniref:MukB N-terminal domain/M protein repeat protein n=1 Tax=Natranaerobius thermophilus (strain ATCC BAA-1301 / DSM 18059 / JW/NM-WN-LF) TaxID=457570 RepID=B2A7R0_NATTJ|nr:SbcC/MukB-like Walker B domain-containing protein [Natranaerobius thermophilus]ACB84362.1 MukB N-terminal domain/M protein repeat protein [Natranaerobius thermophilus JW/NM-WN-LF]
MRSLTKVKLVNWHFFSDETMEMDNSVLITGDNGAGKSTLIDALQVVLVGNLAKVRFNSSAFEEKTTRNIKGYLKGKTGTEGETVFLRDDHDFTSYIIMEIFHSKTKTPYLVGVLFDYYQNREDFEHVFFRIDNEEYRDELIYKEENLPRNRDEFFRYLKGQGIKFKHYKNDLSGYLNDLRQLFGGVKQSFFSLIQKGISFSPITHLRSFVYDYILEERQVDVETMRDYFEKFRELEEYIEDTKKEMSALEQIDKTYQEIKQKQANLDTAKYMIYRGELEDRKARLQTKEQERTQEEQNLSKLLQDINTKEKEKTELDNKIKQVHQQIAQNSITIKIENLKKEIHNKQVEEQELSKLQENLRHQINSEAEEFEVLKKLLTTADIDSEFSNYQLLKQIIQEMRDLAKSLKENDNPEDISRAFSNSLEDMAATWKDIHRKISSTLYSLREEQKQLQNDKNQLEQEISDLEKNQILRSDSPTMKLKKILEEHLVNDRGEPVPVDIFCEAMDIKDKEWQNAIEGYLHTQRFDLLVEPGYFDDALELYERYKFSQGIDRVGLVNTDKLMESKIKVEDKALSQEIHAKKPHIKAYAEFLLGRIVKCDHERELKQYRRAITKTCMLYQNYTARQIPKNRYQPPYIGSDALRIQLETKKQELAKLKDKLSQVDQVISQLKQIEDYPDDKRDRFSNLESAYERISVLPQLRRELQELNQQLMSMDTSEIDRLKKQQKQLTKEYNETDEELGKLQTKEGQTRSNIDYLKEQIKELTDKVETASSELDNYLELIDENQRSNWKTKWDSEVQTKPPETLKANYEVQKNRLTTMINEDWNKLIQKRSDFNHEFDFPANPQSKTNDKYQQRYQNLKDSHLVEYQSQAKDVREKAEQSFREHFVAKLRENIEIAKQEVEELNRALKNMKFGTDSYRFKLSPKQELKGYYDMIMDPQLHEGHNLFTESFREKHGETINELFRDLNAEEDAFQEKMQELTDYRSYLDFEIVITDENGNQSYFSKVARDKSGGETQVPFYVAILASFYQVYGMYRNSDTLRLVIFDEAFNRMDADRVEEAIRFIDTLGFQPLIVAPTGKIQLIAPHVHTNLIVMKEKFTSFVERVSRKELLE